MESKSFLDLVKKEILEKYEYNLNGTEVILSKRPSFSYNFDENENLVLNGLGIVKADVIQTKQGSVKIYGDETEKGIIQLIKFELEELCYGKDYLILLDVINRGSWTHQVNGRSYYHMLYRFTTINKPINKRKMDNNESNHTVIESIYNGLSEELGFESARRKLIDVVPHSLMNDASDFLSRLDSERNRMKNNIAFEDDKYKIIKQMSEYRKEMKEVREAVNQTFEMMDEQIVDLQKQIRDL